MDGKTSLIPVERIERAILSIRGEKVMLDSDLAELYGVETKVLNRAVQRNQGRFPSDFMFQLTAEEAEIFEVPNWHLKRRSWWTPLLALRLHRARCVQCCPMCSTASGRGGEHVQVVRAFVRLRQMLASNAELARKLDAMEKKYDRQFKVVFDAIRQLMSPPSGRNAGNWISCEI